MDFFDSVINDIAGVKEPEKDFFETAFDDIAGDDFIEESVDDFSDDNDLVTEMISISGSIAATLLLRLIGSAFRKTSTSIKVSVKINPALKNYEKANSDVIPFKDLVKKSVSTKSIADDDSDDAKKVKKMLAGATSVDFYFKSKEDAQAGENPIIAFTFNKTSNHVTGSGSKSASIFQVSSEAKKHLEYYFNAYLTKHGMVGDPKLNAWVDEWGKKKDDDTVNEDVDDLETDFDLDSEFFSEASVTNLIMAPLSKLRATLGKKATFARTSAARNTAKNYHDYIDNAFDLRLVEKAFTDLVEDVDKLVMDLAADSDKNGATYDVIKKENMKVIKENFKEDIKGSVKVTKYKVSKLNSEILRIADVVFSSCTKIAKKSEKIQSQEGLSVDMARVVSQGISLVNKGANQVIDILDHCMSRYHPDSIERSAYAQGVSSGYSQGHSAGYSSGFSAGVGAGFTL